MTKIQLAVEKCLETKIMNCVNVTRNGNYKNATCIVKILHFNKK